MDPQYKGLSSHPSQSRPKRKPKKAFDQPSFQSYGPNYQDLSDRQDQFLSPPYVYEDPMYGTSGASSGALSGASSGTLSGASSRTPSVSTYNPNQQYGVSHPTMDSTRPLGAEFIVDPLVNTAAVTYGQHLMGAGKNYVDKEFGKYFTISRLKYYFAVDTAYVYKKLGLIFFPFAHKDWSVKYASNEPVQPRYEVNAPDLYIPTMAYLTYVFVAGLALGTQNRFTPEVLGIQASSALAWTILEILVHMLSIYLTAISTSLTTIDILAFSGYKFVGIIFAVLTSLMFYKFGYYISLIYFSISLSFFLIRTLKVKILPVNTTPGDPYSVQNQHAGGAKRRLYLLLFIAGVQPFLMWWMSFHLIPSKIPPQSV